MIDLFTISVYRNEPFCFLLSVVVVHELQNHIVQTPIEHIDKSQKHSNHNITTATANRIKRGFFYIDHC